MINGAKIIIKLGRYWFYEDLYELFTGEQS